MLTDAFFRRYENVGHFPAFTDLHRRFFVQAAQLITTEALAPMMWAEPNDKERLINYMTAAHDQLSRELGVHYLFPVTFKSQDIANRYGQQIPYTIQFRITSFLTAEFKSPFENGLSIGGMRDSSSGCGPERAVAG